MITLHFTKNFVGGALDGLTYRDQTTFSTLELAEEFVARGMVKGIGADYTISNGVIEGKGFRYLQDYCSRCGAELPQEQSFKLCDTCGDKWAVGK